MRGTRHFSASSRLIQKFFSISKEILTLQRPYLFICQMDLWCLWRLIERMGVGVHFPLFPRKTLCRHKTLTTGWMERQRHSAKPSWKTGQPKARGRARPLENSGPVREGQALGLFSAVFQDRIDLTGFGGKRLNPCYLFPFCRHLPVFTNPVRASWPQP